MAATTKEFVILPSLTNPERADASSRADELFFTPAQAAEYLEVSAASLRRLAKTYEAKFGTLPRDAQHGRRWPAQALERLEAARQLVANQQAVGVEQALEVLYPQATSAGPAAKALSPASSGQAALQVALVEEMRGLRKASERQLAMLDKLLAENAAMQEQLASVGKLQAVTDVVWEVAEDLQGQLNEIKQIAGPQAGQRLVGLITPLYDGLREIKTLQEHKQELNLEPLLDKTLELSRQKVELQHKNQAMEEEKQLLADFNEKIKDKLEHYGKLMPEEMAEITRLKRENERLKIKASLLKRQVEREREEYRRQGFFARLFGRH